MPTTTTNQGVLFAVSSNGMLRALEIVDLVSRATACVASDMAAAF
jgi:hypothetical protein